MKLSRTLFAVGIVAALLGLVPGMSSAQTGIVSQPQELYRFLVSYSKLGYRLTPNYSQGFSWGYAYNGVVGTIYLPPAAGYTPVAGSGLVPLYEWRVLRNGGVYWLYDTNPSITASNYTFMGSIGYVFPPFQVQMTSSTGAVFPTSREIIRWFSQQYEFWYGTGIGPYQPTEYPPLSAYVYNAPVSTGPDAATGTNPDFCYRFPQAAGCGGSTPAAGVLFVPPPPPPPPPVCDPWDEVQCWNSGGIWDEATCICSGGGGCQERFCSF